MAVVEAKNDNLKSGLGQCIAELVDNSFDEFSPDQDNQTRLWGAAGVRLSPYRTTQNDNGR